MEAFGESGGSCKIPICQHLPFCNLIHATEQFTTITITTNPLQWTEAFQDRHVTIKVVMWPSWRELEVLQRRRDMRKLS